MAPTAYKALEWEPLWEEGMTVEECARALQRLEQILESWRGTKYSNGQQLKGVGVDCTRFSGGVLDELRGVVTTQVAALPYDASLHNKAGAESAMRELLRLYAPLRKVGGVTVQPGDFVITGPAGGGPGHAMIAGPRRGELWQTNSRRVWPSGLALNNQLQIVHGVYRDERRREWAR